MQCLKPTWNEQQNRARILFGGDWVMSVCLVVSPDFVFQCGHVNFDDAQGAIYLISHT